MKKELDLTKPMQTRDGRKVELLTDNLSGNYPLAGVITEADGGRKLFRSTREGRYCVNATDDDPWDIINVPTKQVLYFNIYPGFSSPRAHHSRRAADGCAGSDRIACVRVEVEDGQFDE